MKTVLAVYGTRPEAIKMAPLVRRINESGSMSVVVAVTGQHRQILDQVNGLFGISPTHDLDVIVPRQTLEGLTAKVLNGMTRVIDAVRPDAVLVQGDTTTTFAGALSAFYQRLPVIHVEAGLRTGDRRNPYPEETNRILTTQLADLHLAPTATARENLLASAVDPAAIAVTGNTVIDALLEVVAMRRPPEDPRLHQLTGRRTVLVTTHRRESWGAPMASTARAIARLAERHRDVTWVLPVHPNPVVQEVLRPTLQDVGNVLLVDPLSYSDLAHVMSACELVVTDSGGIQEEAPSLGKPVLVLRETTERPEAVTAGTVRMVGTDEDAIVASADELLTDPAAYAAMAHAVNPYGDGRAAARSVQAIEHFFGLGPAPEDFTAESRGLEARSDALLTVS